jgi:hypothetical protein
MNGILFGFAKTAASPEAGREALELVFIANTAPVFVAAKTVKHEVAESLALQRLGVLTARPDEYELVMTLRVTK